MEKVKNRFESKVEIYHHPNPEIRSFLTNTEISAHRVEIFERPLEKDWGHILKELGIIGGHVVKEVMAIQEVEEIHIKPKEVRIKKATSSSWDKIEKKVVEILMRALRRKQIKVIKA